MADIDNEEDQMGGTLAHVAKLTASAVTSRDQKQAARELALEYYDGVMNDLPANVDEDGNPVTSTVVSKDVRAIIKKVMPSLMRTILGNDRVVKYSPVTQADVEGADQATDYVNLIAIPEGDVEDALHDAIQDSLLLKTGILKWSAYTERKAVTYDYSDISDEEFLGMGDGIGETVLDHETSEETDEEALALDPNARRHTFRLRRIEETTTPKIEAVNRASFLMSDGVTKIEDAELVGEEIIASRSTFVSMGYDREKVESLAVYKKTGDDGDDQSRQGDDYSEKEVESRRAMEIVQVFEVYVRLDLDKDGIAEIHRIVFGRERGSGTDGAVTEQYIELGNEEVSEAPYAKVVSERAAHEFEGHATSEDTIDIQRVKSVLLRAAHDNIYQKLNPRKFVDISKIHPDSIDDIDSAEFGKTTFLKPNADAREAVQWEQIDFIAQEAFSMLEYWDGVAKDRTGITDASGGVDPEAFQNTSATAANLMSESGIAQADAMVRSLARDGLRKAFRGLLKLVIAHADGPRSLQKGNGWVSLDPSVWNSEMNCVVNVGMGGGTKERDLAVLQVIKGLQTEIIMGLGADNPYVKPDQLYNTLEKIVETAGFPSAQPFFTKPDPEEVKRKMAASANRPNPEAMKFEAQKELEAQKAQAAQQKEQAQMIADLETAKAEMQRQAQEFEQKMALQREQMQSNYNIAMAKIEGDLIKNRESIVGAAITQPVPDIMRGGIQ